YLTAGNLNPVKTWRWRSADAYNQIKSNQIKSNQIKSNQIKSNQIKCKRPLNPTFSNSLIPR
ncbi:hypothetical protein J890_4065, partial [Acinetobacter baumannii 44327_7]